MAGLKQKIEEVKEAVGLEGQRWFGASTFKCWVMHVDGATDSEERQTQER